MLKNIIFDCSDVLLRFHGGEILAQELSTDDMKEFYESLHIGGPIWEDYDLGKLSTAEAHNELLKNLTGRQRQWMEHYLETWTDTYEEMPGMRDLLVKLKKAGFSLYILSDFPEVFEKVYDTFDYLHDFDGRMISYEVGASKAGGVEIFKLLLKKYHLKAEECFFVDDLPQNIETASKAGIRGHVFQSAEDLEQTLKNIIPTYL